MAEVLIAEAPRRRSGAGPWIALACSCVALGLLDRTLLRSSLPLLDMDLRGTITVEVSSRLRDLPGADPRTRRLWLRRTDEVLLTTGDVAVIQSTLAWVEPETRFSLAQTTGLYGVSRRTRANLDGYGDRERSGQFALPPDPPRERLTLWDPYHPGPLVLSFDAVEHHDGLALLRYQLAEARSEEVDASADYGQLPLVPERYRVRAVVERASLLVEPRTGRILDQEEQGSARFVLASDGTPLGEAHAWSWRVTAEDRSRLVAAARRDLRMLWFVEWAIPTALLLLAAFATAVATLRLRHGPRTRA